MARRYLFTLGERDLTARESWLVRSAIGRILPRDAGKRVYLVDGVCQVENDGQRDRRTRLPGCGRVTF